MVVLLLLATTLLHMYKMAMLVYNNIGPDSSCVWSVCMLHVHTYMMQTVMPCICKCLNCVKCTHVIIAGSLTRDLTCMT